MISELLSLMGMMAVLMAVGGIFRRTNMISAETKNGLTGLLINFIIPCNIIKSFDREFASDIWKIFFQLLMLACAVQLICMLFGRYLYRNMDKGERSCFRYATVSSNAGFMGNPLAQSVFGDTGLLYASVFLIPQRIVMWSAGLAYFAESTDWKAAWKKLATHPCVLATAAGCVLMLAKVRIPGFLLSILGMVGDCCMPLSMLVIGTALCELSPAALIEKKQMGFAVIRLIVLPGTVYLLCRLLAVDPLITGVAVLLTAMPAGSFTPILAAKYHGDERCAAKCVMLTTMLSIFTIPVWSVILK